jgi:hypothetical protein
LLDPVTKEVFQMSEQSNSPRLAQDLLRIHRAISRGLFISVTQGANFVQAGFPSPGLRQGYTTYVQSLTTVLEAHHLAEDELAFPFLKDKVTAAPYDRLSRHHQDICSYLEPAVKSIPLVAEKGVQADLAEVVRLLRKMADIWRPHIQAEEFYFSEEALAAAVSPEDQNHLSEAMARYNQEHALPPAQVLPFVLFNLEADDRAVMAATLPAMVVQELIPKAWKEQWAPMKPFLLE